MGKWEPLLEELITTRHGELVAYAHMLAGDRGHAEDLVQDALMVTFGKLRGFPNLIAAEAYVRKVISSRFIDAKRREKVQWRAFTKIGSQEVDPAAPPETVVEHASDVGAALAELTPRERACVVLRYLEHLSTRETSDQLGISEGSVKRYLSDGLKKMNAVLGTDAEMTTTLETVEGVS